MSDPNATGSRAATYPEMDDNGRRFRIVPNTGPGGGQYIRDYEPHATPDRAATTVKVYPVEHRALRAAIDAVGSPPKLPDWYDALANLWIRIEDSYGD